MNKNLQDRLIEILSHAQGVENKIGYGKIQHLLGGDGINVSKEEIRDIVRNIRQLNLIPCLITKGTKLFIATNRNEMEEYIQRLQYGHASLLKRIESLLIHRENAINNLKRMSDK